jgi:D-serine deaminase-like pyridoxal phosphate-dependent protein
VIDWRIKGFWQPDEGVSFAGFLAAEPGLFDGGFSWPVMVAKQSALDHNLATMAAYAARHGFDLAPHGKTSMSPQLFRAQLEAGAWAITVATASQALAARRFGVPRVLVANEILDPAVWRWIGEQTDAGAEILAYVDSAEGVAVASAAPGSTALPVLLELGYPGARAGCRTIEEAVSVATAVAASPRLRLAGVAGYEGILPELTDVGSYVEFMRTAALELARLGLFDGEVIVSAGGSAFFDLVTGGLGGDWLAGHRLRRVLRSGAYISHDHGYYTENTPFLRVPDEGSLVPALEIWAQVLSAPEAGLVIAGLGKRDAPIDQGLPVPLWVRDGQGLVSPAVGAVTRLNDQHAYVEVPAESPIRPGHLMCFGISHPCTAFDKWRVIPVVSDDYTVTGLLETCF